MSIKIISKNRKASHDYYLEDRYEAGLVLKGTEVKSLRLGHVSIDEAYCNIHNGEAFVNNMYIGNYREGNIHNLEERRTRKLLLHRREIDRLFGKVQQQGYSLIPLKIYFKNSYAKLEFALAKGKKHQDKRQDIIERETERQMKRAMKEYY